MSKTKRINEVDINGSKVYIENGKVKVQLNEDIKRTGQMSVEEAKKLTIESVRKIYEINGKI
ncbi:MAG: hypothetical protein ACI30H_00975 [Paludibacteraceae bacterium]